MFFFLKKENWEHIFGAHTMCSGKTRGLFLIRLNTSSPLALNGGRPVNMLKSRMPRAHLENHSSVFLMKEVDKKLQQDTPISSV